MPSACQRQQDLLGHLPADVFDWIQPRPVTRVQIAQIIVEINLQITQNRHTTGNSRIFASRCSLFQIHAVAEAVASPAMLNMIMEGQPALQTRGTRSFHSSLFSVKLNYVGQLTPSQPLTQLTPSSVSPKYCYARYFLRRDVVIGQVRFSDFPSTYKRKSVFGAVPQNARFCSIA